MKESSSSRAFSKWCEAQGFIVIKLTTLGRYGKSGWPDHLVLMDDRKVLFIEMKRPGEQPTKLQRHRHEDLKRKGHIVVVTSSAEEARAVTLRAASVSGGRDAIHGVPTGGRTPA